MGPDREPARTHGPYPSRSTADLRVGLEAVTIVWIAARFTAEHRSTLDWLNKITDDSFRFFGLEVELWRIGTSPAAPKFNIVSKPNAWSHSVAQAARTIHDAELSETRIAQRDN